MIIEMGRKDVVIEGGFNKEGHKCCKLQRVNLETMQPNNSPCTIIFETEESLNTLLKMLIYLKGLENEKI